MKFCSICGWPDPPIQIRTVKGVPVQYWVCPDCGFEEEVPTSSPATSQEEEGNSEAPANE